MGFAGSRALTIHRGYLEWITRIMKQICCNYIMLLILLYSFFGGGKGYLFNSWQDQVVIPVYFCDYFNVSYITLMEKTL